MAKIIARKIITEEVEYDEENEYLYKGKKNHLKEQNLYKDFFILNQEFLMYIISCNLTGRQLKIFLYIMAKMDKENKIILDNNMIAEDLNIASETVSRELKILSEHKIIIKQNRGAKKNAKGFEVSLNFDIVNPQLGYKNGNSKENIQEHKRLINLNTPYIRQININGGIDLVNNQTGEIFHEVKETEIKRIKRLNNIN